MKDKPAMNTYPDDVFAICFYRLTLGFSPTLLHLKTCGTCVKELIPRVQFPNCKTVHVC